MTEKPVLFKENKMGVMPVNKLLISMSLPMMASMLVQALYNIVDSIFVAQINEHALTALILAFPIQYLMIAVITGTRVGINALLSKSLGEKKQEKVDRTAANGILLAFLSSLLFLIFGLFFVEFYLGKLTDIVEIIQYGTEYLTICCIFAFIPFIQITFEGLLQSTGKTFYAMISQTVGAVTNIILDPIMIFGLFGFPRLGVTGAAIATVLGQFVAMLLAIYFNFTQNHEIALRIRGFKPNWRTIRAIYTVGIPSILMMSIGSIMLYGMNAILIAFSSTATAILGIYYKLQSFVFLPVIGLSNGMVPIISYNYGARNRSRIIQTIKYGLIYGSSIMVAGFAIFQIFPRELLLLFNASEEMIKIGIPALRIISICFLFAGACVVLITVFQALGNAILSLCVSAGRQLVTLLPAAFLLARFGGLQAVWWAFPIAEIVSVVLSIVFMRYLYYKEIKQIPNKTWTVPDQIILSKEDQI